MLTRYLSLQNLLELGSGRTGTGVKLLVLSMLLYVLVGRGLC